MNAIDLETAIDACMQADQPRLRRRLAKLDNGGRGREGARRARSRLRSDIGRSAERRLARQRNLPQPDVPGSLPIASARDEIARTIDAHPVTIVCGETGSGKTTQLPKICLSIGRGVGGLIGHTQPRRIAARGVALRIASELEHCPGPIVGHKVRFDHDVSDDCYVKVMTDGILLAEIQSDPLLNAYDTLIIDEAHERGLNVDFLLGYLKSLLPARPDLKLVISSATIDTQRFSDFFDGAPVVEVVGTLYPVEVRYQPEEEGDGDAPDRVTRAVDAIASLWDEQRGDILAFFPGEREIVEAVRALEGRKLENAEILPLYARLSLARQRRAIEPGKSRRVVLATNVAETSLTVPNVRCVVDTGVARVSRYNRHAGVQRLPIEPVSRASAAQRRGRCGRTGPGVCVRLYSQADHDQRPEFAEPEILRSNLASVLLRMRALGIRDLDGFPFLDAPARRHVNDGLRLLRELGALDAEDELTRTGRSLARIPLDPRLGRMLLSARTHGCVAEILVIAAALSSADPRERPPGREAAANAAHRRYADQRSDFLTLLNLWILYQKKTHPLPENAVRAFCRKRFLSLTRMREWQDVHDQLRQVAVELGIHRGAMGAGYAKVHKALLTGLLRNVGYLSDDKAYTGVRGASFQAARGSAQHGGGARWVMAAELVETSRLYAFTAARIRPEWVEEAAGDLVRKSYFEAHWDEKRGEPMVYEQSALYGLTIIPRRRRRYLPISASEARRIFIRAALVEGRMDRDPEFLKHNRRVVDRLRGFDHRLRQPDVLISDDTLFQFYAHRVPSQVCDVASFDGWVRQLDEADADDLRLDQASIIDDALEEDFENRYPETVEVAGQALKLRYRFAPGAPDDGITLAVPVGLLGDLDARAFDGLVPGYLEQKANALLRALPKSLRREIVPLKDFVAGFMREPRAPGDSMTDALAAHARRLHGVDISDGAWREDRLPDYLRMNYAVIDAEGRELAGGRSLDILQRRFAARVARAAEPPGATLSNARAMRDWAVGDLDVETVVDQGGRSVTVYPMLEDKGDGVALSASESLERAQALHRMGVRRLFLLACQRDLKRIKKNLPGRERLELAYATVHAEAPDWQTANGLRAGTGDLDLCDQLLEAAADKVLGEEATGVRREAAFRKVLARDVPRLPPAAAEVCALAEDILERHRNIRRDLDSSPLPAKPESLDDIHRHLDSLIYRGFVVQCEVERLEHYPRYLEALERRIRKIRVGGAKDADKVAAFRPHWERFLARARDHAARARSDPERERYRWMLEEFRVSLFAQEVGTAHPVSPKRLDGQWAKVSP